MSKADKIRALAVELAKLAAEEGMTEAAGKFAVEPAATWKTTVTKTPLGESIPTIVATPGEPVEAEELIDGVPAFLTPPPPLPPMRTFDFSANPTIETQDVAVQRELDTRRICQLVGPQSWASPVVLRHLHTLRGLGRGSDIIAPGNVAVAIEGPYQSRVEDLSIDNCDIGMHVKRLGGSITVDGLFARANIYGMLVTGIGERSEFRRLELHGCTVGLRVQTYGGYGFAVERFNIAGCNQNGLSVNLLPGLPYRMINTVFRDGEIQGNGGSKYPEVKLYGVIHSCAFQNAYVETTGSVPKLAGQIAIGGDVRDMRFDWQCQINCKSEWTPAMVIGEDVPDAGVRYDGKMSNTRRPDGRGFVVCEKSSDQIDVSAMQRQPTIYAPDLKNWTDWLDAKTKIGGAS